MMMNPLRRRAGASRDGRRPARLRDVGPPWGFTAMYSFTASDWSSSCSARRMRKCPGVRMAGSVTRPVHSGVVSGAPCRPAPLTSLSAVTACRPPRPIAPQNRVIRASRPATRGPQALAHSRRFFAGNPEFLLRTVIGGGHVVVRAGPGRGTPAACCRQASDAAGGPGRAGYSARPAAGQTPATWPPPTTAPVRPHHSAEPSGYVAACGRQGRRASGLQQRTGRDP